MSFKPFGFTFTPPQTVTSPVITTTSANIESNKPISGNSSKAGQIVSKLNDLIEMSKYLQNTIILRTGKTAIEIDPAIDPNTSRALSAIYGTEHPPNFITIEMYDKLLDANLGVLQLEMSLGSDSAIQPNTFQVGDLITVIKTVDQHLIQTPSFNNWLPLQLSSLKTDTIIFQSWANNLSTYPAYYATQSPVSSTLNAPVLQVTGIDLGAGLYLYENDVLTRFGQAYSGIYQSLATISAVDRDINLVMQEFFYQPLQNMLRIVSLLNSLSGLAHKPNMEALQADLINYAFARLVSETSGMLHTCDQLIAMAVSPLQGTLGSLGHILAQAKQAAVVVGVVTHGGLSGMSKANACAASNPANQVSGGKPLMVPGLGVISDGLKSLSEHLNWAQFETTKGFALLDKSFRQLLERRLVQQGDRSSVMCSINSLGTLIGLGKAVVNELQKGTITANSSPQQQQEVANRILTSLQTGSNTTFVAAGDQIITNPPDMPEVTDPVQRVLTNAKIITTLGDIVS